MQSEILVFMKAMPCAQCGKTPSHSCFVRPQESGGPNLYFNLFPLCVKHASEHERIGTKKMTEKYRNIFNYISHKGWVIEKTITHRDLKES